MGHGALFKPPLSKSPESVTSWERNPSIAKHQKVGSGKGEEPRISSLSVCFTLPTRSEKISHANVRSLTVHVSEWADC